ncbi:hypothetical protein GKR59_15655 [Providencia alcalifaciens]|uniref:hypothetical protein n=1 Tax=Providencia TaxID=586 RepID=UPI0012B603B0|nr:MULTISPECIES: hypothetical protein [Providencia]MTC51059.1 hypothetical protein [Providencia alcalifaciens]
MDKSRKQFEEYFLKKPQNHIDPLKKDQFGYYYYLVTRAAWEAWQASRESLINNLEPVAWMWPVYHSENNQLTDDPVVSENIEMHLQSHGSPLKVIPLYRLDK